MEPHKKPKTETLKSVKIFTFKFLGMEIPLARPGIIGISVLTVIVFGAYSWFQFIAPHIQFGDVSISKSQLVQLQETQKHFAEDPEVRTSIFSDARGEMKAIFYRSDGCLLVSRRSSDVLSPATAVWILDPARIPKETSPGAISGGTTISGLGFSTPAYAGGNCMYPHPGEFRYWYGERKDPWVQIWRQWPDGCTHYQWYNAAYNYWALNPDGSPQIFWTMCNH